MERERNHLQSSLLRESRHFVRDRRVARAARIKGIFESLTIRLGLRDTPLNSQGTLDIRFEKFYLCFLAGQLISRKSCG